MFGESMLNFQEGGKLLDPFAWVTLRELERYDFSRHEQQKEAYDKFLKLSSIRTDEQDKSLDLGKFFGVYKDNFFFTIEELQDFMAYLILVEDEQTSDLKDYPWAKHICPNFNHHNLVNTNGLLLDRIFYRVRDVSSLWYPAVSSSIEMTKIPQRYNLRSEQGLRSGKILYGLQRQKYYINIAHLKLNPSDQIKFLHLILELQKRGFSSRRLAFFQLDLLYSMSRMHNSLRRESIQLPLELSRNLFEMFKFYRVLNNWTTKEDKTVQLGTLLLEGGNPFAITLKNGGKLSRDYNLHFTFATIIEQLVYMEMANCSHLQLIQIATNFSLFEGSGTNCFWVQINLICDILIKNTKPNGGPIDPSKEALMPEQALMLFEADFLCTSHPKVKRQFFFKPSVLDTVGKLFPKEREEFDANKWVLQGI